jgi:hypothetical protein
MSSSDSIPYLKNILEKAQVKFISRNLCFMGRHLTLPSHKIRSSCFHLSSLSIYDPYSEFFNDRI